MKNKKFTFVTTKSGNAITRYKDRGLMFIGDKLAATIHRNIEVEEVLEVFPVSEVLYVSDDIYFETIPSNLHELSDLLIK